MPEYVRLSVPSDIADDLLSDQTAVRSFGTRGGTTGSVYAIVVDSINTGAAAVSVAVGLATCRRLVQAFMRRRRQNTDSAVKLTIAVGDRSESIEVDLNQADAEDRLFDFFVEQLDAR